MVRRRDFDETELKVLRTLRRVAVEGGGWKRGGVRGWLLGPQLNRAAGSSIASLYLPRLRKLGLVLGEGTRDPGRKQPVTLWRITREGEAELARVEARAPEPIDVPAHDPRDEKVIYISINAWACLSVLKRHHPRWVRWRDVVQEARRRFRTWVYLSDMLILLSRGLAEREDEEREGERKVIWYRGTRLAHGAKLLDGEASGDWAQIRLPDAGMSGR